MPPAEDHALQLDLVHLPIVTPTKAAK
jgi:hypothetical protein